MRIALSGISSAIGQAIAVKLLAEGHCVVGFCRTPHLDLYPGLVSHPRLQFVSCDVRVAQDVRRALARADAVVHAAALSSPWGKREEFFSINVQGTRYMAESALEAGCSRFVHISSPSVLFDYRDQFDLTEEAPLPDKLVNPYAETKALAEQVVLDVHHRGLPCVMLRPRALFGPGDRVLLPRVLRAASRGILPRVRKTPLLADVTYMENAAEAVWLALQAPLSACGEVYHITNGEPIDLYHMLKSLLRLLGYDVRERMLPYGVAQGIAWACEGLAHLTRREPLVTRYGMGLLRYAQTLSIEKARQRLRYCPKVSIEEGMYRYAHWWKSHHAT